MRLSRALNVPAIEPSPNNRMEQKTDLSPCWLKVDKTFFLGQFSNLVFMLIWS